MILIDFFKNFFSNNIIDRFFSNDTDFFFLDFKNIFH